MNQDLRFVNLMMDVISSSVTSVGIYGPLHPKKSVDAVIPCILCKELYHVQEVFSTSDPHVMCSPLVGSLL